jgi:hypothetical protein
LNPGAMLPVEPRRRTVGFHRALVDVRLGAAESLQEAAFQTSKDSTGSVLNGVARRQRGREIGLSAGLAAARPYRAATSRPIPKRSTDA